MLRRLSTAIVTLLFALQCALPAMDTFRCLTMGVQMTEECCALGDSADSADSFGSPGSGADDGAAHLKRRCCERVQAMAEPPVEPAARFASLAPDQVAVLLPLPVSDGTRPSVKFVRRLGGEAWSSPPGDRLHRHSSVQRV